MSIAFDSSAGSQVSGTSALTYSHTCAGSNRLLLVGVTISNDLLTVSGITYGGVAMTQIDDQTATQAHSYLYYLIAPTAGANNVVISTSGNQVIIANSVSYTGVRQVTQPDAHNKIAGVSLVLSVVNGGCWIIGAASAAIGGGVTFTAGSGFTLRSQGNQGGIMNGIEDSNGPVPTGNNTVAFSTSSGSPSTVIAASLVVLPIVNTLTATKQSYILTMINAILLSKQKIITAVSATFNRISRTATLTYVSKKWSNIQKNVSLWINQSKS